MPQPMVGYLQTCAAQAYSSAQLRLGLELTDCWRCCASAECSRALVRQSADRHFASAAEVICVSTSCRNSQVHVLSYPIIFTNVSVDWKEGGAQRAAVLKQS
jgi:hypothetical protein